MKGDPIIRGRGRLTKTIREFIEKDLALNGLFIDMIYDRALWCCSIHVANPMYQEKAWLLLLLIKCSFGNELHISNV